MPAVEVHYVLDDLLPISAQPTLVIQDAPSSPLQHAVPLQHQPSRPTTPVPSLLPSPTPTANASRAGSPQGYVPTRPPSRTDEAAVQEADRAYDRYLSEEYCPLNEHLTYANHLPTTHQETPA